MVYSMDIKNKNSGFSLIELAMVLFILSLMLSSFLTPLAVSLEQRDREKTNELLEEVRESLIGYAFSQRDISHAQIVQTILLVIVGVVENCPYCQCY